MLVVCVGVIDKPSWRLDLVYTISQRVLAAGRSCPLEASLLWFSDPNTHEKDGVLRIGAVGLISSRTGPYSQIFGAKEQQEKT